MKNLFLSSPTSNNNNNNKGSKSVSLVTNRTDIFFILEALNDDLSAFGSRLFVDVEKTTLPYF
jgi:hypothetical protein